MTGRKRDQPSKFTKQSVQNPVYANKDKTLKAQCMYLYYVDNAPNVKVPIKSYCIELDAPIAYQDIGIKIYDIVNDIVNDSGEYYPSGWNLGDLRWRRQSYYVIVFDNNGNPNNEVLCSGNAIKIISHQNGDRYPFKDGGDLVLSPSLTAFYCLNHLTFGDGQTTLGKGQEECFEITLNHECTIASGPQFVILNHTDTGTNMGPPVGPP